MFVVALIVFWAVAGFFAWRLSSAGDRKNNQAKCSVVLDGETVHVCDSLAAGLNYTMGLLAPGERLEVDSRGDRTTLLVKNESGILQRIYLLVEQKG